MKIRIGFVSNSSSSSYIVEFESREQMITVGKGADLTVQDFFDAFYPSHFCDNELTLRGINISSIKHVTGSLHA